MKITDAPSCPETEISGLVYDSLMGQLLPEYRLAWVEDIFVPGNPCFEAYKTVREAFPPSEPEDDRHLDALLEYSRIVATEMFEYGRKYQKMMDSRKPELP